MVAGLPNVLEHGALGIVASFNSEFHSNPSTDKHSASFGDRNGCTSDSSLSPGGTNRPTLK